MEKWHAEGVAREAFDICGTSVFTGSQASQLAWLRAHEPDALENAATICHAQDWLFFKLTGKRTTDETDESLTMLRMSTRQYDAELFRIFGIEDLFAKFLQVLPSEQNRGSIRPDVAEGLGLPLDLTVVSGPMDVAACALGQASTVRGTAGIHQVIMDRPILEPRDELMVLGQLQLENLDRDNAVEANLPGLIDRPHAPAADPLITHHLLAQPSPDAPFRRALFWSSSSVCGGTHQSRSGLRASGKRSTTILSWV